MKRIFTKETRLKMSQSHIGKKLSEETKQKMSLARKGIVFSEEHRRNISLVRKGMKFSDSHRRNIAESKKGNHYRYIKDRSKLKKSERKDLDYAYMDWTLRVKNRDKWKCKIADKNCKGRLESHHILSWKDYPELRYEVNNGITLCVYHHPRSRMKEKQLSPYFSSLLTLI